MGTKFFSDLLRRSNLKEDAIKNTTGYLVEKLSEQNYQELNSPFTKEEIEYALKSMAPHKALGPDGVRAMFYQKYWDIIREDTTSMCLGVLNEGEDIRSINKNLYYLDS